MEIAWGLQGGTPGLRSEKNKWIPRLLAFIKLPQCSITVSLKRTMLVQLASLPSCWSRMTLLNYCRLSSRFVRGKFLFTSAVLKAPLHPNQRKKHSSASRSAPNLFFYENRNFLNLQKGVCKTISLKLFINCPSVLPGALTSYSASAQNVIENWCICTGVLTV